MNKRQLKKRARQEQLEHEHELEKTAWGRIELSYEHLGEAVAAFVDTLVQEADTLRKQVGERLLMQVKAVDQDLAPRVAKVPVVGPAVARSIHQAVEARS